MTEILDCVCRLCNKCKVYIVKEKKCKSCGNIKKIYPRTFVGRGYWCDKCSGKHYKLYAESQKENCKKCGHFGNVDNDGYCGGCSTNS